MEKESCKCDTGCWVCTCPSDEEPKSKMVFTVFSKPGCEKCEQILPTLVKDLLFLDYEVIEVDTSTVDGLAEAAMRGIHEVPVVIGEITSK